MVTGRPRRDTVEQTSSSSPLATAAGAVMAAVGSASLSLTIRGGCIETALLKLFYDSGCAGAVRYIVNRSIVRRPVDRLWQLRRSDLHPKPLMSNHQFLVRIAQSDKTPKMSACIHLSWRGLGVVIMFFTNELRKWKTCILDLHHFFCTAICHLRALQRWCVNPILRD
jgi:hypothetical protein